MAFLPKGIPFVKRMFDLVVSLIGLLFLSPLLILISIAVILFYGQPVLFRQQRPGYRCKPFSIFKFRTMADEIDSQGILLPDAERLTWLGRFLRATSLDELPELLNVAKGDMSLVGPRPLLMQYLDRYTPQQIRRHEVLPGMTGWAQINGRNTITWEDKFRYDVWYVDHWTFLFDMKILGLTLWKVLLQEGINQPGHISAGEFMGTDIESREQVNDVLDN
jgi:lipopolysaccharide/colanic/teichoic acid biosynthesis glycosyltransferase